MTALRLALPMVLLVLSRGLAPLGAFADAPGPADEMRLTLTGTVRLPDGSPASGVIVESNDDTEEPPIVARTDGNGRFRIRGVFGNGAPLHARSADGNHQAIRIIPAGAARSVSSDPIELTLAPAISHEVVVLADGRPAEGAHVVASGFGFEVQGVTFPDGRVRLQLPAPERLRKLTAWHRRLGVQGSRSHPDRQLSEDAA
jgi:hypothetical protein